MSTTYLNAVKWHKPALKVYNTDRPQHTWTMCRHSWSVSFTACHELGSFRQRRSLCYHVAQPKKSQCLCAWHKPYHSMVNVQEHGSWEFHDMPRYAVFLQAGYPEKTQSKKSLCSCVRVDKANTAYYREILTIRVRVRAPIRVSLRPKILLMFSILGIWTLGVRRKRILYYT